MSHSPGPWTVLGHEDRDGNWSSLEVAQHNRPHMRVCFMTSDGPAMENATLIAAAPELFEMVRRYASECANCNGSGLICTGNSGTPEDGYAPITEQCEECMDIRQLIGRAGG